MKKRLDQILVARNFASDLDTAKRLIFAGEVFINDNVVDKVGTLVDETATIRLKDRLPFVSRGGIKLEKAIKTFAVNVEEKTCLDVGASTGGFTDCLLQYGAARVFAIDVAYGQLAWKLRQDSRVTIIERYNARYLDNKSLDGARIQLAVIDVSFISLTKILPAIISSFTHSDPVEIIALIKPQFELAHNEISAGGVVSNPQLHEKAIEKIQNFIYDYAQSLLCPKAVIPSPILGPKGNKEFLIYITT